MIQGLEEELQTLRPANKKKSSVISIGENNHSVANSTDSSNEPNKKCDEEIAKVVGAGRVHSIVKREVCFILFAKKKNPITNVMHFHEKIILFTFV